MTPQQLERFEEKYQPIPESGCWIWTGARGSHGYGMVTIEYCNFLAHRLSYMHYIGDIPADALILHKCDIRCCVNPNHLFVGSHADNSRDMSTKGRSGGQKYPDSLRDAFIAEYANGKFTQKELAEKYGISTTHANRWVNNR